METAVSTIQHVLADRRRSRRRRLLDEHGITAVRVRPGCDAAVIDVSAGGTLVESPHRLMPGSSLDVQLLVRNRRIIVHSRVIRCEVSELGRSGPIYRGALNFDRPLSWLADGARPVYRVPTAEDDAFPDERGDTTPQGATPQDISPPTWNVY
jgi:hypothetical protein